MSVAFSGVLCSRTMAQIAQKEVALSWGDITMPLTWHGADGSEAGGRRGAAPEAGARPEGSAAGVHSGALSGISPRSGPTGRASQMSIRRASPWPRTATSARSWPVFRRAARGPHVAREESGQSCRHALDVDKHGLIPGDCREHLFERRDSLARPSAPLCLPTSRRLSSSKVCSLTFAFLPPVRLALSSWITTIRPSFDRCTSPPPQRPAPTLREDDRGEGVFRSVMRRPSMGDQHTRYFPLLNECDSLPTVTTRSPPSFSTEQRGIAFVAVSVGYRTCR